MADKFDKNAGRGHGNGPGPGRGHGPGGGPMMGRPVEKAKNFRLTFKRLLGYIFSHKIGLTVVLIMTILSSMFTTLAPKQLSKAMDIFYDGYVRMINGMEASIDFNIILRILFVLGGLYVFSSLFNYLQGYIMASISQDIIYGMRREIDEKLTRLPIGYFDKNSRGDILSRMSNDIDNIGNTLQQALVQIISSIVSVVGIIIMMLIISPIMALVVILSIPLIAAITLGVAKKSQKYFKEQWATLGKLNGHIEETFTGADIVKAFGYERKSIDEFREQNDILFEQSRKAQFVSGVIMPLTNSVNNLTFVLLCIIGGMKVVSGTSTFGDVTAFIQYQKDFSRPLVQITNLMNVIQSAIASSERVFELLDETEETERDNTVLLDKEIKGDIVFEHVKFGYSDDNILIKDMNVHIKPGQVVAIVGPTGAGKTTLVNLLMRFYEINDGRITIDGTDIRDIKREELRSIFGMVLQDTWLFSGSIFDNIAYGSENDDKNEVIGAARAAHVHRFVKTLSKGYDTILNEEGTNVSQGQKQLITIARAMISQPNILILDEATSSVDTRTELLIQEAMERLLSGHTSFVIAHRLSTIKNADLILVMNNGDIIEQGDHESLMAKNGFYADLYNSQFATL